MLITKIFTDIDGESHFDNIEYPLYEQGEIGFLSDKIKVKEMVLRETSTDYNYNFHVAPAKQYVVLLDGRIEIEPSLGNKREFKGGDILLLEDTWGKGHKTRTTDHRIRRSLFIVLE